MCIRAPTTIYIVIVSGSPDAATLTSLKWEKATGCADEQTIETGLAREVLLSRVYDFSQSSPFLLSMRFPGSCIDRLSGPARSIDPFRVQELYNKPCCRICRMKKVISRLCALLAIASSRHLVGPYYCERGGSRHKLHAADLSHSSVTWGSDTVEAQIFMDGYRLNPTWLSTSSPVMRSPYTRGHLDLPPVRGQLVGVRLHGNTSQAVRLPSQFSIREVAKIHKTISVPRSSEHGRVMLPSTKEVRSMSLHPLTGIALGYHSSGHPSWKAISSHV